MESTFGDASDNTGLRLIILREGMFDEMREGKRSMLDARELTTAADASSVESMV